MAEEKEIEKLKGLPPKERLAKLKEIEEKRKKELQEKEKEIEEARKLIEQSVEESDIEEKNIEIEALARKSPVQAQESNLEETIAKETTKPEEGAKTIYGAPLEDLKRFYDSVKNIRNDAAAGNVDRQKIEQYEATVSQLERVNPKYAPSQQTKEALLKIKYAWEQIQSYSYVPSKKQKKHGTTGY